MAFTRRPACFPKHRSSEAGRTQVALPRRLSAVPFAWSLNGMFGWLATFDRVTMADSLVGKTALLAATPDAPCTCCTCWGLTFDMRGGRQLAKPDVARPLDGRVRHHCDGGSSGPFLSNATK